MLEAIFKFLTLPRVIAALCPLPISAYARRLGRRDGDDSPGRNDLAVSTVVLLMSVGGVLKDLGNGRHINYYWLVGGFVALLISIDHDRKYSWILDGEGKPSEKKAIFLGIVVPDVLALLAFFLYLGTPSTT